MDLIWMKCNNGSWCDFVKLNLTDAHFDNLNGVYIIFNDNKVVRVGSGVIKDRIAAHRNDPEILAFGNLKVTWAKVGKGDMRGVEYFLSTQYKIAVGDRFPNVAPIEVNLPR